MQRLVNAPSDRWQQGDWWLAEREFYPAWFMGDTDRKEAFEIFGAAMLRTRPGRVNLTWHVDYSDDRTLATAMDYLSRLAPPRPVRLRFFKGAWSREDVATPAAAVARMRELEAFRGVAVPARTMIRALRLRDLGTADPLIRTAFETWYRQRDAWDWADSRTGHHGLIFEPEAGELKFCHVGPRSECRRLLGNSWRARATGTGCDDAFEDPDFNSRTSAAFYRVQDTKEPIYDHVMAHMRIGGRDIWLPYQRVVLPTPGGVAVFTKVTPRIDVSLFSQTSAQASR